MLKEQSMDYERDLKHSGVDDNTSVKKTYCAHSVFNIIFVD